MKKKTHRIFLWSALAGIIVYGTARVDLAFGLAVSTFIVLITGATIYEKGMVGHAAKSQEKE